MIEQSITETLRGLFVWFKSKFVSRG